MKTVNEIYGELQQWMPAPLFTGFELERLQLCPRKVLTCDGLRHQNVLLGRGYGPESLRNRRH